MGKQRRPDWEGRQRENDEKQERKREKRKLFCEASQAAIALHSWAVEISHKADACISSACLSCHISNSWLTALIARGQGVCLWTYCIFIYLFFPSVCWGLNVCGIRRRSRQRETPLRGSRSAYYLCPASETGTEQEASIMGGSVTAGAIRDAWGDRSAVHH